MGCPGVRLVAAFGGSGCREVDRLIDGIAIASRDGFDSVPTATSNGPTSNHFTDSRLSELSDAVSTSAQNASSQIWLIATI